MSCSSSKVASVNVHDLFPIPTPPKLTKPLTWQTDYLGCKPSRIPKPKQDQPAAHSQAEKDAWRSQSRIPLPSQVSLPPQVSMLQQPQC